MSGVGDRLSGMVEKPEESPGSRAAPRSPPTGEGLRRRVLLYAPPPAPARAYLALLEAEGWDVLLASDPASAEALMRGSTPELVLAVTPALAPELASRWQRLAPQAEIRSLPGLSDAVVDQVAPASSLLDFTVRALMALVSLLAGRQGEQPERIGRTLQLATAAARELGMNRRDLATVRLAAVLREVPELLGEGARLAEGGEATEQGLPDPQEDLLEILAAGVGCPLPVGAQEDRGDAPTPSDVVLAAARLAFFLEHREDDPALALRRLAQDGGGNHPGALHPAAVEATLAAWRGERDTARGEILVVDGDATARILLTLRLRNEGYAVSTAADGREALEAIRRSPPDLVLSEIVLARIDGLALLDALRREGLGRTQVVFLSARSDPASVSKALMLGAADVLVKPVNAEILLSKVQKFLGQPFGPEEATARLSLAELSASLHSPLPVVGYHELTTGTEILGRFEVEQDLGQGGMGKVLKARDLRLEEVVVLKILKPALAEDVETLRRFKREIRLARRISHPGVVRIFDFWEAGPLRFVTMEYLDGNDLAKEIRRRGAFPVPVALRIAGEVLEALAAAHAVGVLHRDIKPHNVLLLPTGKTKVLDFGIAQGLEGAVSELPTLGAYAQGTPEYMSPEQVLAEPLDVRSDLYAAGVLAYQLLTGELPFQGKSRAATAQLRLSAEAPNPSSRRPEIPQTVDRWVARLLRREREDRFPSTTAALEALQDLRR